MLLRRRTSGPPSFTASMRATVKNEVLIAIAARGTRRGTGRPQHKAGSRIRLAKVAGLKATHADTGRTFACIEAERAAEANFALGDANTLLAAAEGVA
jgi:hypothetical protein